MHITAATTASMAEPPEASTDCPAVRDAASPLLASASHSSFLELMTPAPPCMASTQRPSSADAVLCPCCPARLLIRYFCFLGMYDTALRCAGCTGTEMSCRADLRSCLQTHRAIAACSKLSDADATTCERLHCVFLSSKSRRFQTAMQPSHLYVQTVYLTQWHPVTRWS